MGFQLAAPAPSSAPCESSREAETTSEEPLPRNEPPQESSIVSQEPPDSLPPIENLLSQEAPEIPFAAAQQTFDRLFPPNLRNQITVPPPEDLPSPPVDEVTVDPLSLETDDVPMQSLRDANNDTELSQRCEQILGEFREFQLPPPISPLKDDEEITPEQEDELLGPPPPNEN